MAKCNIKVNSPHVNYTDDYINVNYNYLTTKVQKQGDVLNVSLNFSMMNHYICTHVREKRIGFMMSLNFKFSRSEKSINSAHRVYR